jgi:hypothetical protein
VTADSRSDDNLGQEAATGSSKAEGAGQGSITERVDDMWEAKLARLHIRQSHRYFPLPMIHQLADLCRWFDMRLARHLPLPYVKTNEAVAQRRETVITLLGHSMIRLHASHHPQSVLPSALDLDLDDSPLWIPKRFEALIKSLSQFKPIHDTRCDASTPRAFIGLSQVTG